MPAGTVVAVSDWTQLVAVDQGGGAAVDPTPLGDTGTGFSAGEFRHVWGSHTSSSNADGYQEGVLWWSSDLLTLYPSFDPEVDLLELVADFSQFGVGTNDGAGAFLGLSDGVLNTTVNAALVGLHRAGVSNMQARLLNTTSASSLGNVGNHDQLYTLFSFIPATTSVRPFTTPKFRNAGSSPATYDYTTNGGTVHPTLSTTLANWRICTGSYHVSATDPAGLDVRWSIWHRLITRPSGALP